MNYITNDEGDVKVRTEKGLEKWLPKHLVENKFLMTGQGLEIVPAPLKFEDDKKTEEIKDENTNVAEVAPAKRGRKPNNP